VIGWYTELTKYASTYEYVIQLKSSAFKESSAKEDNAEQFLYCTIMLTKAQEIEF
jgi:hypothetical protein